MAALEYTLKSTIERLESSREAQFWSFQIFGWGGLCVVTFLSLTVWYGAPNWSHVSHTIVQALMGIALCFPLRNIFQRIWSKSLMTQFTVVLLSVIIVSALWTALRMQAFFWLGQEYDIWKDFGGWYFGSFMVFISWSAFYYGIKYYQLFQEEREQRLRVTLQIKEEQLKRMSAEAGSRESQMKMLRYQLNPHFLFNTLNSISALVKTKRTDQARTMLAQLSHFLRFSLDSETMTDVTLSEEAKILELYLDIEKVRYGDRLTTAFSMAPEAMTAIVPCLILQPLFENALQYAIAGQIEGGQVRMVATVEGDKLHIHVADSGDQITGEVGASVDIVAGVGLNNIEQRLISQYGSSASVGYYRSDIGGLEVRLTLPYVTQKLSQRDSTPDKTKPSELLSP